MSAVKGQYDERFQVFVSYSRKNVEFAHRLVAAIEARGVVAHIDERDLPAFEDWRRELTDIIHAADAVVFVISSDSIASPVCAWEVGEVVRQGKRLAPVVMERVAAEQVPQEIRKLNYLYFDPPHDFETQADQLVAALLTDVDWVKEHTRLGQLARRWDEARRPRLRLLGGRELREAERWLANQPSGAPPPSSLHLEFVRESRRVQDETYTKQSLVLAKQSEKLAQNHDAALAMLLALEGLPGDPRYPDKPYVSQAESALYSAWCALCEIAVVYSTAEEGIISDKATITASLSPDGARGLCYADDCAALLWDACTGAPLAKVGDQEHRLESAGFSHDGNLIATRQAFTASVWDAHTGTLVVELKSVLRIFDLKSTHVVMGLAFSPDSQRIAAACGDHVVVFSVRSGEEQQVIRTSCGPDVRFNSDGSQVISRTSAAVECWDVTSGKKLASVKVPEDVDQLFKLGLGVVPDLRQMLQWQDWVVFKVKDRCLRLCDLRTGSCTNLQPCDLRASAQPAFSPDCSQVATVQEDQTVRIWKTKKGKKMVDLKPQHGPTISLAFTPDSHFFLTASADGTASLWSTARQRFWEPQPRQELVVYRGHEGPVASAHFNENGHRLLTSSTDRTARVWETVTGKVLAVLKGHADYLCDVLFSNDGERVLTTSEDGTARLWDSNTRGLGETAKGRGEVVSTVSFSRDGSLFVTTRRDGPARVWDAASGAPRATLDSNAPGDIAMGAKFSPDGRRILTVAHDHTCRLWDGESGAKLQHLQGHKSVLVCVDFAADSKTLVTVEHKGSAIVWNAETGTRLRSFRHPSAVEVAVLNKAGWRLVTLAADGKTRFWDLATGQLVSVNERKGQRLQATGFKADGTLLWATQEGEDPAEVLIWDAARDTPITQLKGESYRVNTAAFSPGAVRLATLEGDSTVRIWDANSGDEQEALKGEGFAVGAHWCLDARTLVVAYFGGDAILWDVEQGKRLATLVGHKWQVTHAAMNSERTRILTAAQDGTARVWNAQSEEQVAVLRCQTSDDRPTIQTDFFGSDQDWVVTSCAGTLQLWRIFRTTEALIEHAKTVVPRALTPAERVQFFLGPEPPRWYITGPGAQSQAEPANWLGKWPYGTDAWKGWLQAKDAGENLPTP